MFGDMNIHFTSNYFDIHLESQERVESRNGSMGPSRRSPSPHPQWPVHLGLMLKIRILHAPRGVFRDEFAARCSI